MNEPFDAEQNLIHALMEWRDAGGDIIEITAALEEFVRGIARDEIDSSVGNK